MTDATPAALSTAPSDAAQVRSGLRKLAASAALIRASLMGDEGFASGTLHSPELRIRPDGEFQAWVVIDGVGQDMFLAWPNKFGQLAFGFAGDHFKMLHEAYWKRLAAAAHASQRSLTVAASSPFGADEKVGLSDASPERMTAPALMALCKRMASAPEWLMGALDDLEKGKLPTPPKTAARSKSTP